jgi:dephospho-CoA kinase
VQRIVIAGGIGAGKTVATNHLSGLGWTVVDADQIAHEITEPGRPAWRAMRDAFGDAVLNADETLDRAFVADVVFHDPSALRRLNHITHGHIGAEIARQIEGVNDEAVFVALPLFRLEHRSIFKFDEVWSIQVAPETAVDRLRACRGFSEDDARARLANQMTNEERGSIADRVMWNEGTIEELLEQIDAALLANGLRRG